MFYKIYLDYFFIFVFILVALVLALILFSISYFFILKNYDIEKISIYECGFEPFIDTRNKFDIRFYLVAILFIIFDLEIMFLFPWSLVLMNIGFFGFCIMVYFLFILLIGFFYEWYKGALDWE